MKTAEEILNEVLVDVENRPVFFREQDVADLIGQAQKEAYTEGYNEAMRWRDPNTDPPTNQDVVLVKTDNNCYATAYYHGKASGFITYGEDAYVEFGEIIGWRPIE